MDFSYNKPMPEVWHKPNETYIMEYRQMFDSTHLLIGGETGSGKSTVLNGILLAALTNYSPSEAMFYLVDTKEVELAQYKELPHTISFVTEASDVPALLRHVCDYMDREYHRMAEIKIRKSDNPHLYILIDEIADLMTSDYAREIKRGLQRILQKGRACNIHVIACTQSPSRKTLPAEVVLNFTNRVALHCASAIESRQILNEKGAEDIKDYGTVLYKEPMKGIRKLDGLPCYSDEEVERRVNFWVNQIPNKMVYKEYSDDDSYEYYGYTPHEFTEYKPQKSSAQKRQIVTRVNGGWSVRI